MTALALVCVAAARTRMSAGPPKSRTVMHGRSSGSSARTAAASWSNSRDASWKRTICMPRRSFSRLRALESLFACRVCRDVLLMASMIASACVVRNRSQKVTARSSKTRQAVERRAHTLSANVGYGLWALGSGLWALGSGLWEVLGDNAMQKNALIVGCGIGGPVAAMALQRAGFGATIYEAYDQ